MKAIVVSNAKGGVGKTTTAVTVAQLLAETGRRQDASAPESVEAPGAEASVARVLLLDTDPQGSATLWVEGGEPESQFGFDVAWETNPEVLSELRRVSGYDYVVVDTQPALRSEGLRAVLSRADYALLPSPPEAMDYPVLMDTLETVIWPMGKSYRVLLTLVDPRTLGEARAVRQELRTAEVATFESIIRHYRAHKKARLEQQPVTAYKGPRSWAATRDYRRAVDELIEDLEATGRAPVDTSGEERS